MELNLMPIMNFEGKQMTVDHTLDVETRKGDTFEILSPVKITGTIVNIGGCLELEAEGNTTLSLTCDRCGNTFSQPFDFQIKERYKKEETDLGDNENPDIIVLEGNTIDLCEIAYDNLVLSLPSKILCDSDCKGLCSQCGKNLNNGSCDCDTTPTDPRFDILDKLL